MKRAIVILLAAVAVLGIGALAFLKIAARGVNAREEPTATEKVVARTARIRITTRVSLEGSPRSRAIDGAQRESTNRGTNQKHLACELSLNDENVGT